MHTKSRRLGEIALILGGLAGPAAWAQGASSAAPAEAPAAEPTAAAAFPTLKDGAKWEIAISPYTLHWSNDPEHKNVWLVGLSRLQADGTIWGLVAFSNSFGQPSAYGYYGHIWEGVLGQPRLYAKLSVGILYGYKGKYEDKVPFNHNGWSPAIIPAVGWRLTPHDGLELAALGTAGLSFIYNRRF
ncbi:ABC transporter ATP-binding protein [Variovorax rhizosphaerae]|uniref:ABC transporter ATP-binding protein n=1 Tax=Variovorax rhizosphaerae TaxID=1836200 RepID=A0ABU8WU94_9BURK